VAALFGEEAKTEKVALDVKGMTCSGCASFLQSKLGKTEGIKSVKVDLANDQAFVEYDPQVITAEKVATAVDEKTAFTATVAQAPGVETQAKPDVKEAEPSPTATQKSVSKATTRKAKTSAKPEASVFKTKYRCEHCKLVQNAPGKCSMCGKELTAVDVSYECAACGVHSATARACPKCGAALKETFHKHTEKQQNEKNAPSAN
jgi:copper chaperone CopZ